MASLILELFNGKKGYFIQMKQHVKNLLFFLVLLLIGCSAGLKTGLSVKPEYSLEDILVQYPAENEVQWQLLNEALLKWGEQGILQICDNLVPTKVGGDSLSRYAISGLTKYLSRAGLEKQRKMYVRTILRALEKEDETEVQHFLIEQLQWIGGDESVKHLARFLNDDKLCDPAVRALKAIGSSSAKEVLLKGLKNCHNKKCCLSLILTLGELEYEKAFDQIKDFVDSKDKEIRDAAFFALASLGQTRAISIFQTTLTTSENSKKNTLFTNFLLLARRLKEKGNIKQCEVICRDLLNSDQYQADGTVKAAALRLLVEAVGESAIDELVSAITSEDKAYRSVALELAVNVGGPEATNIWIEKLKQVSPEKQAEIVTMLGDRGDTLAFPIVQEMLSSENKNVRLAAIVAMSKCGRESAIPHLMELLRKTNDREEIRLILQNLEKLIESRQLMSKLVNSLDNFTTPAIEEIIHLLVERNARDHTNRLVEVSQKLVDLFPRVNREKQRRILRALPRIGSDEGLKCVREAVLNFKGEKRTEAIRSLSNWRKLEAIDPLFEILEKDTALVHKILALRGLLQILKADTVLGPVEKLNFYQKVMHLSPRYSEKKMVLAAVSGLEHVQSLKYILKYLQDDSLKTEAAMAAYQMAVSMLDANRESMASEIIQTLITSQLDSNTVYTIKEKFIELERLNEPPPGFRALFNGKNLAGWKGLVGNPVTRAKMTPEELAKAQAKADSSMREHWRVENGILIFDGKGKNICTVEEFGDFELLVDWKIEKGGDSGIYLRGSPQVQIWDITERPEGSGGLYNNKLHPSKPLVPADLPPGKWNRFRIIMIGDRVTVYLNGVKVVDNVVMENYWERDKPIYSRGPIELQAHNTSLYFRNIFIREIPREEKSFKGPLFNGKDLTGWELVGAQSGTWRVENGVLITEGRGGGWLSTTREFDNFKLELDFRVSQGGNSGVFIRAPHEGDPAYTGMEIQILDDYAPKYANLKPWQYTGSIYGVQAPAQRKSKPAGTWQHFVITCDGPNITVELNGDIIIQTNLIDHMDKEKEHPGLKRRRGFIGLQNHGSRVEFRNIYITELGVNTKMVDK